jgi:hypothetical protein
MREPTSTTSTRILRGATVLLLMGVLVVLSCNFAPLLYRVIELDIPTPPGGIVSTRRYRTALAPFGELVWDRHYRIPTSTFASLDNVQRYFDTWITDHGWEISRDTYCYSVGNVTYEEVDALLSVNYVPIDWYEPSSPPGICLMIIPISQDGYYNVRLITFELGLFGMIDD